MFLEYKKKKNYICGVYKSGHQEVGCGNQMIQDGIFLGTMSYKRFIFLLAAIQFDNPVELITKKSNCDKLVFISEIFQHLLVT